jgi:RNA ligase (TIGR02306 family)
MRKLASIQRILAVDPIEGADRVERLKVLGWQLVSGKGNFKEGDLCIYFEVDSVMPDTEVFDFLWQPAPTLGADGQVVPRAKTPRPDNQRLRSKRIRKVISQGLALPTSILPDNVLIEEGADVTEVLGVSKWDPPIQMQAREIEGSFPSHVFPKTDETRVQAAPAVLDELRGTECYMAVKMDGQSLTFARYLDGEEVVNKVCTRNYALRDIPESPHWDAARRLRIFEQMATGYAVQGEFCGPGIQANRLGLKEKTFYAFQVYDIVDHRFLGLDEFTAFCSELGVTTVPIEWRGALDETVESLLKRAEGKYSNGYPREGLVIRSVVEQESTVLTAYEGSPARASFKAINNEFLLKIGD